MKKLSATVLAVFATLTAFCQVPAIQPKVDERMELLSIVFRIAGADEYINNQLTGYTKEIDSFFAPYKNCELINFTRKLRHINGVSFDAVMSMAASIEFNGGIRFKENLSDASLDKRWGKNDAEKFLQQLNRFYKESNFHEFFVNHLPLFTAATTNFSQLLRQVDFTWFQTFYGGILNGNFNLVVSLTNGGSNYGVKARFKDGKEELYAIIGTWKTDNLGQPVYTNDVIATIIHEYNHSFCNPLIDDFFSEMEPAAVKFYNEESAVLQRQAYSSAKTMSYEILVRACVIRYYQKHLPNPNNINRMIVKEKSKGFLWIEDLVNALAIYELNRDKYPALKDYMPEIVKVQNELSPTKLKLDFDSKCARIISLNIINNSRKVDPGIKEIIVKFDRPMNTGANGSSYGKLGKDYFPEVPKDLKGKWSETTKMEWAMPVILKPNTQYSISFPSDFFMDEQNYPLNETYYLDFKTKK